MWAHNLSIIKIIKSWSFAPILICLFFINCELLHAQTSGSIMSLTEQANLSTGGEMRFVPFGWKLDELHKDLKFNKECLSDYCLYSVDLDSQVKNKSAGNCERTVYDSQLMPYNWCSLFCLLRGRLFPPYKWKVTADWVTYKYPAYIIELSPAMYVSRELAKGGADKVVDELLDYLIENNTEIITDVIKFHEDAEKNIFQKIGQEQIQKNSNGESQRQQNLEEVKKSMNDKLRKIVKENPMMLFQRVDLFVPRFFPVPGINENAGVGSDYKKQGHLPHFTPSKMAQFLPYEWTDSYQSESSGRMKSAVKLGIQLLMDRADDQKLFNQRGMQKYVGAQLKITGTRGARRGEPADKVLENLSSGERASIEAKGKAQKLMEADGKGGGSYSPSNYEAKNIQFKDPDKIGARIYQIEDPDKLPSVNGQKQDPGFNAAKDGGEEDALLGVSRNALSGAQFGFNYSDRLLGGLVDGTRLFTHKEYGPEITKMQRKMGSEMPYAFWPGARDQWLIKPRNRDTWGRMVDDSDDSNMRRPSFHASLDGVMALDGGTSGQTSKNDERLKKDLKTIAGSDFVYYDNLKALPHYWKEYNRKEFSDKMKKMKGQSLDAKQLEQIIREASDLDMNEVENEGKSNKEKTQEMIKKYVSTFIVYKTYSGCMGFPGYGMNPPDWGEYGSIIPTKDFIGMGTLMQHAGSLVVQR